MQPHRPNFGFDIKPLPENSTGVRYESYWGFADDQNDALEESNVDRLGLLKNEPSHAIFTYPPKESQWKQLHLVFFLPSISDRTVTFSAKNSKDCNTDARLFETSERSFLMRQSWEVSPQIHHLIAVEIFAIRQAKVIGVLDLKETSMTAQVCAYATTGIIHCYRP